MDKKQEALHDLLGMLETDIKDEAFKGPVTIRKSGQITSIGRLGVGGCTCDGNFEKSEFRIN